MRHPRPQHTMPDRSASIVVQAGQPRRRGATAFLHVTPYSSASQTQQGRPFRLCALKHAAAISIAVGMLSVNIPANLYASELVNVEGRPRVVDGDTFVFETAGQKQRVRLKALDAFELKQVCFDPTRGGDYLCGVVAREEMVNSIIRGRKISCQGKGNDVFGRLVATCAIAETGEDVGEQLVRSGWALAFRQYGKEYVAAEDEARAHLSGAWAGQFESPWTMRQAKRAAQSAKN